MMTIETTKGKYLFFVKENKFYFRNEKQISERGVVIALSDIEKGKQLTITYLDNGGRLSITKTPHIVSIA